MSTYKVTLIGIENFLSESNRSVFDRLILPEGIDKELVKENIILQAEEKELLYSDPDFLTAAIDVWGRKNYWTFDKWLKAINTKYEPLWNFDRNEEWEDIHQKNSNRDKHGYFDSNSNDSSMANTHDEGYSDGTTQTIYDTNVATDQTKENKEAAFNASTYQEKTKEIIDSDVATTGDERNESRSNTGNNSESNASNFHTESGTNQENEGIDEAGNATHKGHLYGNIGITSSQQLLQAELDVARFNLYDQIADLFISEFCLMVY